MSASKAVLRRVAARQRVDVGAAVTQVTRPLAWIDQMLGLWRRVTPLVKIAAVPLSGLVVRSWFGRSKLLDNLVSWGPMVWGAMRGLTADGKRR